MVAMRGPGERLRQLLNRNNPENSFEDDEQQVEKVTSVDQTSPLHSNPLASQGPLSTSARRSQVSMPSREEDVMEKHETPHSTSTLQANGHKLPRPHVGMIRENRKEATDNLDDETPTNQRSTERFHRISGHGYQHHRKSNDFTYKILGWFLMYIIEKKVYAYLVESSY